MASISEHAPDDSDSRKRRRWFPVRIGLRTLAKMCHNVGTGLRAGVDIRRIWENEAARGSLRHRATMSDIRDRVASGDTMTSAIAQAEGYFPALVKEMVDVGERTGRLDQVFARLGEHYDTLLRMRRAFLIGIAWPVIELSLALLVIGLFILILGMIPSGPEGPTITVFGLYGTRGLTIYCSIVGAIFFVVAAGIMGLNNGWFRLDPFFRLLMNLPGIGQGLKVIAMSRLTWSMAMATDSDIDAARAAEIAIRTTQNSYYTSKIARIKDVIMGGGEMREAFETAGGFPNDFLDMLHAGELSGRISESMQVLAKDYEDRTKLFYGGVAVAAGVAVFLLVGVVIIFMIVTFFMQYVNVLNNAANFS